MTAAAEGHLFRISINSRGSFGDGAGSYQDADWWGEPMVVDIRAWSLKEALEKALEVPFATWAGSICEDEIGELDRHEHMDGMICTRLNGKWRVTDKARTAEPYCPNTPDVIKYLAPE